MAYGCSWQTVPGADCFNGRGQSTTKPQVFQSSGPIVISAPLAEHSLRQFLCRSRAALASSSQPAVEPVCYLGLALSSASARDIERGQDPLFCAPNPNGIWPVLSGNDEEGTWVKRDPVFKEREQECGLLRSQERLSSMSAACRGCGCNCGCTLLHIGNVSSICE